MPGGKGNYGYGSMMSRPKKKTTKKKKTVKKRKK